MAKITMTEQPDFDVLPAEMVIKVKVDETKVTDEDGKYGPYQKLRVKFLIAEVPDSNYATLIGEQIWGSIPFKLTDNPDNQLRQWCEALFGFQLSPGFELDTDELVGRSCRAIVGNYEKKSGTNTSKRHQISALLPLRAGESVPDVTAKPRHDDPWASAPENPWATASTERPVVEQQQPAYPAPTPAPAPAVVRQEEEIPF